MIMDEIKQCEMGLCVQALIIVNGVVSSSTNDCESGCEF